MQRKAVTRFLALLLSSLTFITVVWTKGQTQLAHSTPIYSDDRKKLRLPNDFHMWVFVGSNLGLAYRPDYAKTTARENQRDDPPQYHNVYLDPASYNHFVKFGEFPDPTILVMDVYAASEKESPTSIVNKGSFNGKRLMVEVAVKNKSRPDRRDGSITDWAYYIFPPPRAGQPPPEAIAQDDRDCSSCHAQHASKDNVWLQFYPIIRDLPPKP